MSLTPEQKKRLEAIQGLVVRYEQSKKALDATAQWDARTKEIAIWDLGWSMDALKYNAVQNTIDLMAIVGTLQSQLTAAESVIVSMLHDPATPLTEELKKYIATYAPGTSIDASTLSRFTDRVMQEIREGNV